MITGEITKHFQLHVVNGSRSFIPRTSTARKYFYHKAEHEGKARTPGNICISKGTQRELHLLKELKYGGTHSKCTNVLFWDWQLSGPLIIRS